MKTVIYQMYAPSWKSFFEMEHHILRLKELGVDIVSLTEVIPSVESTKKVNPNDYECVRSELGNIQSLEYFADTCHYFGLKLILDLRFPQISGEVWFKDGKLNYKVVNTVSSIAKFWFSHKIDGFRLDVPSNLSSNAIIEQTIDAFDTIFAKRSKYILVLDCDDPEFGDLVNKYAKEIKLTCVVNKALLDETTNLDLPTFRSEMCVASKKLRSCLETETPNSYRRFAKRIHANGGEAIRAIVWSGADFICLNQGQELGEKNSKPCSRLNIDAYEKQMSLAGSYYNITRINIARWKQ